MTGDWVRLQYNHFITEELVTKDFQVTEIRDGGETNYIWGKDGNMGMVEHIQPIPLTVEILEKNGFVSKKGFMQKGNFGDGPLIIWHTEDNKILRHFTHELEISDLSSDKGYRIRFICNYVHELQHALRLCGIDKEIVL